MSPSVDSYAAEYEARRRQLEDDVLACRDALDPNDRSEHAEYMREVAGSIEDHRSSALNRNR